MIPHIIHQIWYQGFSNLPHKYIPMQKTWLLNHPNWDYYLWDQNSILDLIESSYNSNIKSLYEKLPKMIQKIDLAKYLILYKYGGVYVDMDMESIQPLDSLVNSSPYSDLFVVELDIACPSNKKFCLAMWFVTEGKYIKGPTYNNAFLASRPNHPFWIDVITKIPYHIKRKWYQNDIMYIFNSTGPILITSVLRDHKYHNLHICPSKYFEPCNHSKKKCDFSTKEVYANHHFSNTWMSNNMKILMYLYYNPLIIIIIILTIILIIVWIIKY